MRRLGMPALLVKFGRDENHVNDSVPRRNILPIFRLVGEARSGGGVRLARPHEPMVQWGRVEAGKARSLPHMGWVSFFSPQRPPSRMQLVTRRAELPDAGRRWPQRVAARRPARQSTRAPSGVGSLAVEVRNTLYLP